MATLDLDREPIYLAVKNGMVTIDFGKSRAMREFDETTLTALIRELCAARKALSKGTLLI